MSEPNMLAGGNIAVATFVKHSTAADLTVLAAGANERIFGVSQEYGRESPIPAVSTNYAGQAGDTIKVYTEGDTCLLQLGSGGATRGDLLKSDASGYGVTIAASGATAQEVGAIALQSGSEGDLVRVQVMRRPLVYPALS